MQFRDLKINDKFTTKNTGSVVYTKVPEEKASCCQIRCNARHQETNTVKVFRPLDEVTKVEK